jgi:hypothetical protein
MEFIPKIKKNVRLLRARAISGDDKIHKAHVRKAHALRMQRPLLRFLFTISIAFAWPIGDLKKILHIHEGH